MYSGVTGHCVSKDEAPWNYMEVVQYNEKKQNTFKVSKAILHPLYSHPKIPPVQYDIAILKLATPVQTTNFFVCLPHNNLDQFVGQNVTGMGWGVTEINLHGPTSTSNVLKAASFTIMNNPKCREAFEKRYNEIKKERDPHAPHVNFKMYPFIICAETNKPNTSTCYADSGGMYKKILEAIWIFSINGFEEIVFSNTHVKFASTCASFLNI